MTAKIAKPSTSPSASLCHSLSSLASRSVEAARQDCGDDVQHYRRNVRDANALHHAPECIVRRLRGKGHREDGRKAKKSGGHPDKIRGGHGPDDEGDEPQKYCDGVQEKDGHEHSLGRDDDPFDAFHAA
eukprot:CAMPEP_0113555746 /NCGR_PEP_ID=MMETSP0015_2-20120614/16886_2 /TAXON_ID=2838 /ORGANISM="Odontella" /LENGTH=128 /DNA_ID=CAMNT_0000457053 /DNA_START=917 /DNA_END=1299 /DNA_ORIENTATION=- /assembly_acc=CAM_ASM_000160